LKTKWGRMGRSKERVLKGQSKCKKKTTTPQKGEGKWKQQWTIHNKGKGKGTGEQPVLVVCAVDCGVK